MIKRRGGIPEKTTIMFNPKNAKRKLAWGLTTTPSVNHEVEYLTKKVASRWKTRLGSCKDQPKSSRITSQKGKQKDNA